MLVIIILLFCSKIQIQGQTGPNKCPPESHIWPMSKYGQLLVTIEKSRKPIQCTDDYGNLIILWEVLKAL